MIQFTDSEMVGIHLSGISSPSSNTPTGHSWADNAHVSIRKTSVVKVITRKFLKMEVTGKKKHTSLCA
jgi:hypothetical protein